MQKRCTLLDKPQRQPLSLFGKQPHTRFYPTTHHHTDSKGNVKTGTIVDRGLFHASNWEILIFFRSRIPPSKALPSPSALRCSLQRNLFHGHKSSQYPCDRMPQIGLRVLHMNCAFSSARATTAVSIPPPVYYADIACERARLYLAKLFDQSRMGSEGGETETLSISDMRRQITPHGKLKDTMFYI